MVDVFTTTNGVVLSDWQWQIGDLLLGPGTPYALSQIDGFDPPDARVDKTTRMQDHGAIVRARYLDDRVLTFEGDFSGDFTTGEFQTLEQGLRFAWAPRVQDDVIAVRFKDPGVATRVMFGLPIRLDFSKDTNYDLGYCKWVGQIECGDPRIYDDNLFSQDFGPVVEGGGATFPLTFDLSFGGGTSGTLLVTNSGTFGTLPFVRIWGPATNPRITNQTEGRTIRVNIVLAATDYLDIDFVDKTILLGGTASRYGNLDPSSGWWDLEAGENQIQFIADSVSSETKATFSYRSAWQ